MTVDRTHRQHELRGNLSVGQAGCQQPQHLELPLREAGWILPSTRHRPTWHVRHAKLAQSSSHLPGERGGSKRIQDRQRLQERIWILALGKRDGLMVRTATLLEDARSRLPIAASQLCKGMINIGRIDSAPSLAEPVSQLGLQVQSPSRTASAKTGSAILITAVESPRKEACSQRAAATGPIRWSSSI